MKESENDSDTKPRHFIVSVGTSLISKYTDNERIIVREKKELQSIKYTEELTYRELSTKPTLKEAIDRFYLNLDSYKEAKKLGFNLKELSAELSSLLKGEDPLRNGDSVFLVRTKTLSGEICTQAITNLLKSQSYTVTSKEVVNMRAGGTDDEDFVSKGLPELIDIVRSEIEGKKEDTEIILVPTGGYKAVIPYFVILGILYDVPCRYVYEESDNVLNLLSVPLNVDLASWSQVESILEIFEGQKIDLLNKKKLFKESYQKIESLLTEDAGVFKRTPLAEKFSGKAKEERGQPELVYRTRNSPLLTYLSEDLKQKFLRLAGLGALIWKGDRVPEIVDHALLHHADLFSIAERVLLPIYLHHEMKRTVFLAPHELFALLCALHLHDCGHVLGHVETDHEPYYRFFPTEVRDFHHVLGYLRLAEWGKHGKTAESIYAHLVDDSSVGSKWGENKGNIWEQYLKAPAVLGLFHRKKMHIAQKVSYPFVKGTCVPEIPCLEDFINCNKIRIGENTIDIMRVKLLVCLLRIIDSLDEEESRMGSRQGLDFQKNLLDVQATEAKRNSDSLRGALDALIEDRALLKGLAQAVDGQINSESDIPLAAEAYRLWEHRACHLKKEVKDIAFEYAYSTISMHFKRFQHLPLCEKSKIRRIAIKPQFEPTDGEFLKLSVKVESDDEEARERILEKLKEEYFIKEGINGESKEIVAEILRKQAKLVIEYA